MNPLQRYYYTAQAVGWDNVLRRAWQVASARLGITRRRLPGGELTAGALRQRFADDYAPEQAPERWRARAEHFFFSPQQCARISQALPQVVASDAWDARVGEYTRKLRNGRMVFFNRKLAEVGMPPNFNRDPLHGVDWPVGRHWSTYSHFHPDLRDIKCVWEASRFSWAYGLSRDYVRTGDESVAELFWSLFEAWDAQNPYGLTPQWVCGQESSFRMFAWIFTAMATLGSAAATGSRLNRITERVWYTGRHVDRNINYARSQKNNHAISEAVALWTIGLLFPELRDADCWRRRGRKILEAELCRQIYEDGSYVQNSTNYHRVMLDDVLWGVRLGEIGGESIDALSRERLAAALRWLLEMIEPDGGRVPNYGANDGAQVLPLSTCDYLDYRPVAQAMYFLLHRKPCFEPGPWDEKMLWLFGPEALAAEAQPFERSRSFAAEVGGYYTLKGPKSWGMMRCHTYKDRPAQADMLHFDLWYGRHNVLRDGGTFHYYTDPPWQHYFESTAGHNTLKIDGEDQMIRGPRFLWFRWTKGRSLGRGEVAGGRIAWVRGLHTGYQRLTGGPTHFRSVVRIDDAYVIVDDVTARGPHELALRWRLCPGDWAAVGDCWRTALDGVDLEVAVHTPAGFGCALLAGLSEPSPEGWESLYYAEKTPAPTIVARGNSDASARFVTIVSSPAAGIVPRVDSAAADVDFAAVAKGRVSPLGLGGVEDPKLRAALAEVGGCPLRAT